MAQTILLTPDTLRSQAAQIRAYTEEHDEIIQQLTNLILSLDEVWTGEAQTAFINRFQNAKDIFSSFDAALADFSQMMDNVAEKMESTDRSLKSRIARIS